MAVGANLFALWLAVIRANKFAPTGKKLRTENNDE